MSDRADGEQPDHAAADSAPDVVPVCPCARCVEERLAVARVIARAVERDVFGTPER